MRRLAEILIVANGVIIPVFIGIMVYRSFKDSYDFDDYKAESLIVGDKLEEAVQKGLALQGVSYDAPVKIENSSNFYLPISAKTFKEARKMHNDAESAGDFYSGWFNYVNVLFLDKEYKVIGRLLDKKASIAEITMPGERQFYSTDSVKKAVRNIAYEIGFDDTNKDGKLDYQDDHDLYISDLNGGNLTQVTSNKYVVDYEFIKLNSEIFIRYLERDDQPDEYKPTKFGIYRIATGEFRALGEIEEEMKTIEEMLTK